MTPSILTRVSAALACMALVSTTVFSRDWAAQAVEDASQDRSTFAYDGATPNKMVCDTTLRELPDKSWILFILALPILLP